MTPKGSGKGVPGLPTLNRPRTWVHQILTPTEHVTVLTTILTIQAAKFWNFNLIIDSCNHMVWHQGAPQRCAHQQQPWTALLPTQALPGRHNRTLLWRHPPLLPAHTSRHVGKWMAWPIHEINSGGIRRGGQGQLPVSTATR